jgi:competence protein ComEC
MGFRLATSQEGVERVVVIQVDTMPRVASDAQSFTGTVLRCEDGLDDCPQGLKARLSWPSGLRAWLAPDDADASHSITPTRRSGASSEVWAAEIWRFKLRFKRARSTFNPGLFDQELRWLEDGIGALASVRSAHAHRVGVAHWSALGAWWEHGRQRLRAKVWDQLEGWDWGSKDAQGVVVALALGDQAAISAVWWERFNRTGLSHLMSISGLHITLLAGIGRWVISRWWRSRVGPRYRARPIALWCSAQTAGWVGAILIALAYSMLAGWGIPAQRTCLMLVIAACARMGHWPLSASGILALAAAVVCVADPWAVLAPGFWLSFVGVACLMLLGETPARAPSNVRQPIERLRAITGQLVAQARELIKTQWAVTLALTPICIVYFSSISVVGPVLNLVAIPVVSAFVTPLALVGLVSSMIGLPSGFLLASSAAIVDPLLRLVQWADTLAVVIVTTPEPGPLSLALGLTACLLMIISWGERFQVVALPGLAALVMTGPPPLATGTIRIQALDIGQGMAVLVQTPRFNLLYDTGPPMGTGQDAGQRVVVPWLRANGVNVLHAMVVSHRDSDHSGGAISILRKLPVQWVASPLDAAHPIVRLAARHYRCERGERWSWDDVHFEWLHPSIHDPAVRRSASNALSCVLMVRFAGRALLLAGDIEAPQEKALLERFTDEQLHADVLLAPHHGSATSSTPEFLDAVAPRFAVFQVGYRNRYRHPSEKVLRRYREREITVLRTDVKGALTMTWSDRAPHIEVGAGRELHRRYWHLDMSEAMPP